MRYEPTPRSLTDYDIHMRNMHATIVSGFAYEAEHDHQHELAARGALGEHAEFWTPHTHVVTQDTYREAWSTAYWRARDAGHSNVDSLSYADADTEHMLDALED